MSSFTEALILEKTAGFFWLTYAPFTYHVGSYPSEETITVPARFPSDLASIPRIVWSILPPHDTIAQAAVLHDWLCKNSGKVERSYTPKQVSLIFREAMQVLGVPKANRETIYRAVLWFGPKWK